MKKYFFFISILIINSLFAFDPPEYLEAYNLNFNEVLLTWQPPGGSDILKHHNGYDNNGIGAGGPYEFECAARFTSEDLDQYYDVYELTNILLHIGNGFLNVTVKIWEGGSYANAGTEIYSQDITDSILVEDWTNHILTSPIQLTNGNEYWIGYSISESSNHPCSVDAGPMVPDKGAWLSWNGTWETLTQIGATLNYNWCITGLLSPTDSNNKSKNVILGNNNIPSLRSLAGYKVYQEGQEIAEIYDPEVLFYHDDTGLNAGVYEYYVTAFYTDPIGESEPSNTANVEITLPAPENLIAYFQSQDIHLEWDEPQMETRNRDYYTIYIDDEFFAYHYHELYVIVSGLLSPEEHYCYVTATYDGGFESGPSNIVNIPGLNDTGNLIILSTELQSNLPNPFNPETTIIFSVAQSLSTVEIAIYNLKGQIIKKLVSEQLSAGQHSAVWNGTDESGKDVSSGVYLYKMKSEDYQKTRKMILMK